MAGIPDDDKLAAPLQFRGQRRELMSNLPVPGYANRLPRATPAHRQDVSGPAGVRPGLRRGATGLVRIR